jgi:pyridoxine 5-phosphate synthase
MKLGVNIDHVATLRQARGGIEPDPVQAAVLSELAGADCITFHLREDRRHIQERDALLLKEVVHVKLNMEMACTPNMIKWAKKIMPNQVTLVPEKRQEVTTEGGLDVVKYKKSVREAVKELHGEGISVSLFIDPNQKQIEAAKEVGSKCVEFHTGEYANALTEEDMKEELGVLKNSSMGAHKNGLVVYAGHGLNYKNVVNMNVVPHLEELNIGHSIISRAVFVGIKKAVKEMLALVG